MGLDVLNEDHLRIYLSMMINLQKTQGNEGLNPLLQQGTTKIHSGIPMIAVTGNSIQFGKPTVAMGSNGQKAASISPNFNETPEVVKTKINKLKKHLRLKIMLVNILILLMWLMEVKRL